MVMLLGRLGIVNLPAASVPVVAGFLNGAHPSGSTGRGVALVFSSTFRTARSPAHRAIMHSVYAGGPFAGELPARRLPFCDPPIIGYSSSRKETPGGATRKGAEVGEESIDSSCLTLRDTQVERQPIRFLSY